MTGTPDLDVLRAQYRAAVDSEQRRQRADAAIRNLQDQELEASALLDRHRNEANLAQAEADAWAGKGFKAALWGIIGRLDERREQETAEAIAAAAQFAAARQRLDEVQARLATTRAERPAQVDPQVALDALRAAIAVADPAEHQRIVELEQHAADTAAAIREHDEAIAALDRAADDASTALQRLDSARSMGAWDIMGGGIVASAVKRERVRDAVDAIGRTGTALDRLRRELADIPGTVVLPPGLEMGSLAWTFDVWWDNIISDLNMQGRIRDTQAQVEQVADTLSAVRVRLVQARTAAVATADQAAAATDAALRG
ncbi:MAG: hypothetical protein ACOYMR_06440 [Ilumatobacteraceae bacterium]